MSWKLIYSLDLIAILSFLLSYYFRCYRKGYRIDIWHSQVFLTCILPNCLMLPFTRSSLNIIVLGRDLGAVVEVVPTVFLITLFGYFAVMLGGELWTLRAGIGVRRLAANILDVGPACSRMLMASRNFLLLQSMLCLFLQALLLAFYFSQNGFGFDLRQYTLAHPELRPIALLISTYSVVVASHCVARYYDTRERVLLTCALAITFGLLFFGARSNILTIYINIFLCYLILRRAKIGLFRLAFVISVILLFGLYMGSVRAGEYSLMQFFEVVVALLFYGNTFSDLRDFSWVYSHWDHVFWGGKTYLAAIGSFVPRFASEFRDTWGLGVVTATTVGLDPRVHPGLRPGVFGEGYFNFGWFGVAAIGIALGIIYKRVDIEVKSYLSAPVPSMMGAFASTMLIGVAGALAITAGFSGLYILTLIYVFSWVCLQVLHLVAPRQFASTQAMRQISR